jgi:hypothetical protein
MSPARIEEPKTRYTIFKEELVKYEIPSSPQMMPPKRRSPYENLHTVHMSEKRCRIGERGK